MILTTLLNIDLGILREICNDFEGFEARNFVLRCKKDFLNLKAFLQVF